MPRPRAPMLALTKRMVDAAAPRATRWLLFDGLVHGFALKVEPSGAKVWVVQKSQRGRSVRVTIGRYPDLTVDQARREAQAITAKLVRGGDPTAERREVVESRRRAERAAVTVAELWARYLAEEVAPHNKPSSAALKRRLWERRIMPAIGAAAVRDVTGGDLSAIVRGPLRFHPRTGQVTAGKGEAGNLYRLLHHLFAKSLAWRVRPLELGHPLDGIDQPRVARRERLLSDDELAALLAELDRSERAGAERPQVVRAIRLAAITGWRIGEILGLRWEHVRRDLAEVRLPDTKTGFSARPLTGPAVAILDSIERPSGVPWVLPGIRDQLRPLDYDTVHKAFGRVRDRAGLEGLTPHTLRHRFTTDVANAAPNIRTGMAITGHKSAAAFLGYVHAEKERAKAVADGVGAKLAALMDERPQTTVAKSEIRIRKDE